jgi:IS5 family transposase
MFEIRCMRQRFEQQQTIGTTAISDIQFPLRSRDELPPVLKALQYVFVTPELNSQVFELLEKKICKGKKQTGRKGMDLWHILVLAVVRHALGTNWDRLEYTANGDKLTRKVLGVHVEKFGIEEIEFSYQTIVDNVSLIDEAMLQEINHLVVLHGHNLLKKKEDAVLALTLKTDSYAVETNVHFPTDLNLLWDSSRKSLDIAERIVKGNNIPGWRKIKFIRSRVKSLFRSASQIVFRGGCKDPNKKKQAVKEYLQYARDLEARLQILAETPIEVSSLLLQMALKEYMEYMNKFISQIDRRLLKGEEIPASEKVFSIFEPHTEWITKGKLHPNVELGKLLLVTTDQFQFIVDYKLMEYERDAAQIKPLCNRIKNKFADAKILSHSFDKSFHSKENYEAVKETTLQVIMPKRGKKNHEEQQRESAKAFKKLRNKHSTVESNINMLEHHGLNRCPDKGLQRLKNYVGFSVLAYNLHILGNHLIARESEKQKRQLLQAA